MSKISSGKYAKAISDRSGMEFPYNEMVKEWNGSFVHISEFEAKQSQLASGSSSVTVTEPNHGRSNGDNVRFRNVTGSPGGLAFTVFENSSGFSISSVTTNTYVFDCGSNATITEKAGGLTVTAGPVTQLA
jgi:hypothetical protein